MRKRDIERGRDYLSASQRRAQYVIPRNHEESNVEERLSPFLFDRDTDCWRWHQSRRDNEGSFEPYVTIDRRAIENDNSLSGACWCWGWIHPAWPERQYACCILAPSPCRTSPSLSLSLSFSLFLSLHFSTAYFTRDIFRRLVIEEAARQESHVEVARWISMKPSDRWKRHDRVQMPDDVSNPSPRFWREWNTE